MDLLTTFMLDYAVQRRERRVIKDSAKGTAPHTDRTLDAPGSKLSEHLRAYPNWENGHGDIWHEKAPQYPVYQLPFRAESSYRKAFSPEKN